MSEARFCIACKHYSLSRTSPAGSQHRCNRPMVDVVTGISTPHDAICQTEREGSDSYRHCGLSARFWESRA